MKKKCELCNSPAKLFCESDQASLCWRCDTKVHTANFIVTKHHRFLLCHICQSLTPWHGTGPKFVPTISLCNHCVSLTNNNNHDHDHDDDGDTDDDDDDDEEEEEEENQVVPWTSTSPSQVSTSSSNSSTSNTK